MGQRGPQPKPTMLKLAEGNPGKRPLSLDGEVTPETAIPDMPRHLCPEGRKEWKRIATELVALGLISRLDRAALALYCQNWGRLVACEKALEGKIALELGRGGDIEAALTTTVKASGYQQQAVLVQLIRRYEDAVHKYLQSFGLSPSSRGRVTAGTPQASLPGFDAPPAAGDGKAPGFARFRSVA